MTTQLVQSITDEMVAELESLASKATLGPWRATEEHESEVFQGYMVCSDPLQMFACLGVSNQDGRDADYIATANPATILALLAERKELVRDRERLNWLADPDNTIGNVQLPLKCVTANVHSLRDAIDAARGEV